MYNLHLGFHLPVPCTVTMATYLWLRTWKEALMGYRVVIGSRIVNREINSLVIDASLCITKSPSAEKHPISLLSLIGKW